jgi:hypothetical protein
MLGDPFRVELPNGVPPEGVRQAQRGVDPKGLPLGETR